MSDTQEPSEQAKWIRACVALNPQHIPGTGATVKAVEFEGDELRRLLAIADLIEQLAQRPTMHDMQYQRDSLVRQGADIIDPLRAKVESQESELLALREVVDNMIAWNGLNNRSDVDALVARDGIIRKMIALRAPGGQK